MDAMLIRIGLNAVLEEFVCGSGVIAELALKCKKEYLKLFAFNMSTSRCSKMVIKKEIKDICQKWDSNPRLENQTAT